MGNEVLSVDVLSKILSSSISGLSIGGWALRMEILSCATHQGCPPDPACNKGGFSSTYKLNFFPIPIMSVAPRQGAVFILCQPILGVSLLSPRQQSSATHGMFSSCNTDPYTGPYATVANANFSTE